MNEMDENLSKKKPYDLSLFKRQIRSEYTTRISMETKKELELAFEYFIANISDPYIICQIQYEGNESANVYLIAKDPSKDAYYGIMENAYISKIQMACFPGGNITHSSFRELDIKPFPAKEILEK